MSSFPTQTTGVGKNVLFEAKHSHRFNLPPSQRARPLLVGTKSKAGAVSEGKKRNKARKDNDTPRAFRRIMAAAQGKKLRSGLDDGSDGKTAKKDKDTDELRIQPGEDLRAFTARVDAALPLSGLKKKTVVKDGKDEQGVKVWRTRKEIKMHRLYDQWRAEERKVKEKREDELEDEAEKALEKEDATSSSLAGVLDQGGDDEQGKKKSKKRRGKDDDDPWEELKKKRAEKKVGLHDVAQAPPELNRNKPRQLKIRGEAGVDVENIPKAAGSLRRREELQTERDNVMDAYRKIREYEQAKMARNG